MPEELETVLRLVAEGRLTPEEASPIIDALTRAERAAGEEDWEDEWKDDDIIGPAGFDRLGERISRRVNRRVARAQRQALRAAERATRHAERARHATHADHPGRGRQLRIRVTERGRQVVNLRIPIGFVESALRFVPGLAGDQADRIRDAVRAGAVGPILDVEDPDGEGGVLITVE
jgi:hypothetical protein